jgi:hypothetical protein
MGTLFLVDSSSPTKSSPSSTISSSSRRPSVPLQITLRNPPIRRRLLNGSNLSSTPSPTISPSEFFSPASKSSSFNETPQTPEPPPIPSRCSLVNTTNKHHADQFVQADKTPIKTERHHIRSRNRRRTELINPRSDSADVHSSRHHRRQYSNEQGANSD